jgi:hypothetical protein
MRKAVTLFVAVCLQGLVVAAMAQEQPGNIGEIIRVKVKPGMEKQFEAAGKEHIAWHRQKQDDWAWLVWQVMSGPRTGDYVAATFGHKWADFDNPKVSREEDDADASQRIGPYVESMETQFVAYQRRESRPSPGASTNTTKFSTVVTIHLKPGMLQTYLNAVGKLPAAMQKTNWPGRYMLHVLVNGGKHPTVFLVLPRQKWADFAAPEKPIDQMLEEAYGREDAEAILKTFDKAVASVSSEMIVFRPDLSYVPKKSE